MAAVAAASILRTLAATPARALLVIADDFPVAKTQPSDNPQKSRFDHLLAAFQKDVARLEDHSPGETPLILATPLSLRAAEGPAEFLVTMPPNDRESAYSSMGSMPDGAPSPDLRE